MSAFVRQMAVLSVLWAVCELLLPNGRQQQMVRMTVSVLVMTALLSTAGELVQSAPQTTPALAEQLAQVSEDSYRRTALRAAANQAAAYCERFFIRAGYEAQASVFLGLDGGVERVEMEINSTAPLAQPEETRRLLARQLGIAPESIWLSVMGAEEE